MTICRISIYLAYAMAVYTIASIYYIIMTRNIGTPFKDSLTLEQREIKRYSANIRKTVFLQGCGLAIILCIIGRPFKRC